MHERFERRTSFTIGFPAPEILGAESKFTDGSMSALSGPGGEASFQVAVPLQPGNTGGPLVDNAGQVVGIVTSPAAVVPFLAVTGTLPQSVNWAIKAEYVPQADVSAVRVRPSRCEPVHGESRVHTAEINTELAR